MESFDDTDERVDSYTFLEKALRRQKEATKMIKLKKERLQAEVNVLKMNLDEANAKLKEAVKKVEINKKYQEIESVINHLSGMFLSQNMSQPSISPDQQRLMKNLFGDVATNAYKQRIKHLESKIEQKEQEELVQRQDSEEKDF